MKNRQTIDKKVRTLVGTAILSSVAYLLMLLEFATPLTPSFLKFDFSEIPAFIAAFAYGPLAGVLVELIKNVIHLPFSGTSGVGELANFLIGVCFVLPAGLLYRYRKDRVGALLGCVAGTLIAGAVSFPVNYFITYPFYTNFMPLEAILGLYKALLPWADTLPKALLVFNLPFTMVKGVLASAITFLVYKKLSPLLHGKDKTPEILSEDEEKEN